MTPSASIQGPLRLLISPQFASEHRRAIVSAPVHPTTTTVTAPTIATPVIFRARVACLLRESPVVTMAASPAAASPDPDIVRMAARPITADAPTTPHERLAPGGAHR